MNRVTHNMGYTLLDININKQTDFNHRRKVAWLRSDRAIRLYEGVSASLPYYFLEGEVHSHIQKIARRTKELGYDALILGERYEPQTKSLHWEISIFETLSKEGVDVILKLKFENLLLQLLESRDYLIDASQRCLLIDLLKKIPLPKLAGIYWEITPIAPSLLLSTRFRRWTAQEILTQEVRLFEEAFSQIPLLIAESVEPLVLEGGMRTVSAHSLYQGKPWQEFLPQKQSQGKGYHHRMVMHNRGLLLMGEGLWPIQGASLVSNQQANYWGDCDHFAQFPSDDRFSTDWGVLGLEARLLLLKMLKAKDKTVNKIQFEAWSFHLRELELRADENPLIRHFIADAWHFLYGLQSQPIPQGICQGGFWRGRSLVQQPHPDGSPWYTDSRLFL